MLKSIMRTALVLGLLLVPSVLMAQPPSWCVRIFVNEEGDYYPESMGSGVLVAPEYVVTNVHVVMDRKDDKAVQVMFPNWTVAAEPEVVYTDAQWDIAIIKIRPTKNKYLEFGSDPEYQTKVTMHGYGYGVYARGKGKVEGIIETDDLGDGKDKDDIRWMSGMSARQGDSGGAIVQNGKLAGILNMSDGVSCTVFIVQSRVKAILKKATTRYEKTDLFRLRNMRPAQHDGAAAIR